MNVLAVCCLVTAILGFNWVEIDNEAGMITFCLLYGYVLNQGHVILACLWDSNG